MLKLSASEQHTTNWSGGTTTQLYIYPNHSSYAKRDFLFRISTATVETELSNFTSLPGFRRVLMILKGELTITHRNHYSKHLHTFDSDTFEGGWETSAIGKVTDFNLMMAEGITGTCKRESSEPKSSMFNIIQDDFYGMYWIRGAGSITFNGEEQIMYPGDFISFQKEEQFDITFIENSEWISVNLQYGVSNF